MSDVPLSTVWARGDYPKMARDVLVGLGQRLVEAAGVRPGQRVLDVAAGSGITAIPAAAAGAEVVAVDITPELLAAGQADAVRRGVAVQWLEADAQQLPFPDGDFDAVLSSIGAMFAPDQQRAADEMLRVCRPGGVIAMANWTPDGSIGAFFRVFAPYAPPSPPDAVPPVAWGTEERVRALFGDRVESLWTKEESLPVDCFADAEEFCAYYRTYFGPTIAAFAAAAEDGAALATLERDFLAYAKRANRAEPGGRARYEYEYLLVKAMVR